MKLFYSDKFSEPQGGSPYLAMLSFVVLYYVVTLVTGLLIGGSAGSAIGSDWWIGVFFGIFPTSSRYGLIIGRVKTIFLLAGAIASLYFAKTITAELIPFALTEQMATIEIVSATGTLLLIGLICVKLVGRFIWNGFAGNLFS